jgi:hypothetical protein
MQNSKLTRGTTLIFSGLLVGLIAGACSKEAGPSAVVSAVSSDVATATKVSVITPGEAAARARSAADTVQAKAIHAAQNQLVRPSTDSTQESSASRDELLTYDTASNTVTFELIAGPFTYNGYRSGEATLVVPSKANIVMNFVNKDGTPHTAILISGDGPIPNVPSGPAIPRAYTNRVFEGLAQEASDVMRFSAPDHGVYRIICGVPGHGISGMWIWLKVDPAAKLPSFGPTEK